MRISANPIGLAARRHEKGDRSPILFRVHSGAHGS